MNPSSFYLLIRWLALTAVAEWLINRSLTRFAIFMPKSGPVLAFYQALLPVGQFAFTLTGLLTLLAVGWMAWHDRKAWRGTLSLVLAALVVSSLVFVIIQPRDWLLVGYHLLMLAAIAMLAWRLPRGFVLPAAALLFGELYQMSAALGNALHLPGPISLSPFLFDLGELAVVLSAYALWWTCGQRRARLWVWAIAGILPLSFALFYSLQPAMAGIISIWSLGLTLFLPWPMYALGLWLVGVTLGVTLGRDSRVGWAVLLLTAGGYAPQLTAYAFLGLVALWLLGEESAQRAHALRSTLLPPVARPASLVASNV